MSTYKVAVRLLNSCGECYYCRNGHENQCVKSFIAKTQECAVGPGGFSEYMMMEAADVYKMAEDIELSHAALSEPLACCVHSIENGKIQLGDDVVVIGVGIMGALHIRSHYVVLAGLEPHYVDQAELADILFLCFLSIGINGLYHQVTWLLC